MDRQMIALYLRLIDRSEFTILREEAASRPDVGYFNKKKIDRSINMQDIPSLQLTSSSMIADGLASNSTAMDNRLRCPPEIDFAPVPDDPAAFPPEAP